MIDACPVVEMLSMSLNTRDPTAPRLCAPFEPFATQRRAFRCADWIAREVTRATSKRVTDPASARAAALDACRAGMYAVVDMLVSAALERPAEVARSAVTVVVELEANGLPVDATELLRELCEVIDAPR